MGVAGRMGRSAVVGTMWGVEATRRMPGATRSLDHTRHTAVVVMGQAAGKEHRQQAEQKSGVARKQRRTEAVHRFVPGAKIVQMSGTSGELTQETPQHVTECSLFL